MTNAEIFVFNKFEGKGKESGKPFCVIKFLYLDTYNNVQNSEKFVNSELAKKVQKLGVYKPMYNASGTMADLSFVRDVIV